MYTLDLEERQRKYYEIVTNEDPDEQKVIMNKN